MIEVNMPQDVMKYKTKFLGNFSLREVIGAGLGLAAGLIGYFSVGENFSFYPRIRITITALFALPFFLYGFCKIYGMPAEKAIPIILIDNFIAPAKRKYEVHYPEYEKYVKYEKNIYFTLNNSDTKMEEGKGENSLENKDESFKNLRNIIIFGEKKKGMQKKKKSKEKKSPTTLSHTKITPSKQFKAIY